MQLHSVYNTYTVCVNGQKPPHVLGLETCGTHCSNYGIVHGPCHVVKTMGRAWGQTLHTYHSPCQHWQLQIHSNHIDYPLTRVSSCRKCSCWSQTRSGYQLQ